MYRFPGFILLWAICPLWLDLPQSLFLHDSFHLFITMFLIAMQITKLKMSCLPLAICSMPLRLPWTFSSVSYSPGTVLLCILLICPLVGPLLLWQHLLLSPSSFPPSQAAAKEVPNLPWSPDSSPSPATSTRFPPVLTQTDLRLFLIPASVMSSISWAGSAGYLPLLSHHIGSNFPPCSLNNNVPQPAYSLLPSLPPLHLWCSPVLLWHTPTLAYLLIETFSLGPHLSCLFEI